MTCPVRDLNKEAFSLLESYTSHRHFRKQFKMLMMYQPSTETIETKDGNIYLNNRTIDTCTTLSKILTPFDSQNLFFGITSPIDDVRSYRYRMYILNLCKCFVCRVTIEKNYKIQ